MLCDLALLVWAGQVYYSTSSRSVCGPVYAHITATPHTYVSPQHRLPPSSRLSCLVIRCYVPKQVRGGFHNAVTVPQVADCRQSSVEFRGPRGSTTIRGFGIWTATCSDLKDLKERDQHPAILHLKEPKAAPHGAIARRRI
ncbi:hypothetical protein GE21DRAFT_505 [Neurospora crassa]|uniref:Questionable protein n=1 Tax=Neurospora crassa (strain ATCC 24698 / 74-OR23-1A / CBS 708.71 / DSM 1257 / FGSC 987) TaxID=367110 RepID=Q7SDZ4_NEUCR|nr:hypothetical protein NCU01942 [Neurospora crassa OR74A]EAA34990.1 hypothetical protein NCU01942 [Neurospora crassa OR74A]KHE78448.1 hypothetical protein GE21DRAFT_505 [Neurospora crassa]|eukprot:XP_964226.1 hypothetical protein NCU01942 [Neurospora crassa OR74A]